MRISKRAFLTALAATVLAFAVPSFAQDKVPADIDAWMKQAKLGPYDVNENWDEIIKAAKAEGALVIYSSSSRMSKVAQWFMEVYPEIKVSAFDLGSTQTIEKTIREQDAKQYNADIVTTGGSGEIVHDMMKKHRLFNYVPRHFVDRIPKENREPLLVRVNEAVVFFYSGEAWPNEQPIKNIWELTLPKWKGRVGIKDPLDSGSLFMGIATYVQHKDEMAAAYKRMTGQDIKLSPGVPDAGHEWLYRLLKNDAIPNKSGPKLIAAAGTKGARNPMIAMSNMTHISYNEEYGLVNKMVVELDPAAKIVYPTYTAIARFAKHPNAAKLFTAYSLGSTQLTKDTKIERPYDKGKSRDLLLGFAPFFDPGSVSPRNDVPLPPGGEAWDKMAGWIADPDYLWFESAKVRDFYIQHVSP